MQHKAQEYITGVFEQLELDAMDTRHSEGGERTLGISHDRVHFAGLARWARWLTLAVGLLLFQTKVPE
jgi:hypothetical protein